MRGEQAIFNLEIKKKSGLSLNPDIHHSKVFSSGCIGIGIRKLWFCGKELIPLNFRHFGLGHGIGRSGDICEVNTL